MSALQVKPGALTFKEFTKQRPAPPQNRPRKGKKKKKKNKRREDFLISTKTHPVARSYTLRGPNRPEVTRLRKTEMLCQGASTPNFSAESFKFDPSSPTMGAQWLFAQCQLFDKYSLNSVSYEWIPSVPTTYPGNYWFATDYNPRDDPPTTASLLSNQSRPVMFSVYTRHVYKIDLRGCQFKKYQLSRSNQSPELLDNIPFSLMWASDGAPEGEVGITGSLLIHYDITLYDAHVNPLGVPASAYLKSFTPPKGTVAQELFGMNRETTTIVPNRDVAVFRVLGDYVQSTLRVPPTLKAAIPMFSGLFQHDFEDEPDAQGNALYADKIKSSNDNGNTWTEVPGCRVVRSGANLYDLAFNTNMMSFLGGTLFAMFNGNTRLYAKGNGAGGGVNWAVLNSIVQGFLRQPASEPEEGVLMVKGEKIDIISEIAELKATMKALASRAKSKEKNLNDEEEEEKYADRCLVLKTKR